MIRWERRNRNKNLIESGVIKCFSAEVGEYRIAWVNLNKYHDYEGEIYFPYPKGTPFHEKFLHEKSFEIIEYQIEKLWKEFINSINEINSQ